MGMEMSATMRGKKGGGGDSSDGGPAAPDMDSFMNDPDMMKAAEDMMKSMSPETLAAMAKSSGMDIDDDKAKMLGKLMPFIPYIMKCMRLFGHCRKGWKGMWTSRGRVVVAVVVLLAAF